MRKYEETETWPCSTCGVNPVTARADGKMHHCQECTDRIGELADAFWATMGVTPRSVRPHPSWSKAR